MKLNIKISLALIYGLLLPLSSINSMERLKRNAPLIDGCRSSRALPLIIQHKSYMIKSIHWDWHSINPEAITRAGTSQGIDL